MKFSYQALAFSIYAWGLLTISFAIALPAQAAIVCEPGTISNYANNSLAACNLDQDMTVQLFSSIAGTSSFYCRAKKYIYFLMTKVSFNRANLHKIFKLDKLILLQHVQQNTEYMFQF